MSQYTSFLDALESENQYPIIFIGSGLTLRYFSNAPTWDGLLEQLWNKIHSDTSFYGQLGLSKTKLNGSNYEAYLEIAEQLEEDYKTEFFNGNVKINNLTQKDAVQSNISPMKQEITNIFNTLSVRNNVNSELKSLTQMLKKARLIVTTNYDCMIEELLNDKIKVNVGGKSLFSKTDDFNELFKIHGSVSDPNSIVITKEDYKSSEQTSTLVNAKILSNLIDSPILFLGYSLTDANVRSLLTDLSQNMPEELHQSTNRIGVVEFKQGETRVIETKSEFSDLNVHYTKIETDNYTEIYNKISTINQGLSPDEISKYSSAFKKIIQKSGEAAELDTVLTSFIDLDKLPENLRLKNIVVAFGDARYIYKTPTYADYIEAYFFNNDDFPVEIALSFLEKYPPSSTLPIVKFIKLANLHGFDRTMIKNVPKLKEKIDKRNAKWDLFSLMHEIQIPKKDKSELQKMESKTPCTIFLTESSFNSRTKILYITKNITKFNLSDLEEFTKYLIENQRPMLERTEFRKFFFAYSLFLDDELVNLELK